MKLTFETIDLRTRHAFNIARETAPPVRQAVWVRIEDDGLEGWGEAPATPFYGETAETVAAILPRLSAALEKAADGDVFALERIETALAHSIGRNPAARVAISAALHDLVGKKLGVPVWKLWGLDPQAAPRSSFTIGIDTPDVMRQKVREAAGYDILKIKVGSPHDREVLQMIRDEAPEKTLRVDANTAWTAKEAIRQIPMLEDFGVEFVEQPLPPGDLEGLRLVRKRSRLPIIADESCKTAADVAKLAGVVDGVNIKLAKCGSLREAIRIVHAARAHGMSVMIGCMVESTLGIAAAVPVTPLVDYVDLDGAALLAEDPFSGPGLESDGRMRFSDEPGLGVSRT
ncbi:MAG TPA: dipeptide epimerase [Longimicrobium sp.]|jgi:L-alanine-DL-glutamate epimerase-like enolase superfamily enzyme